MSDFKRRVLCEKNQYGEREELVEFTLHGEIHPGGPISPEVRKSINQKGFDIGHLWARMLGGPGNDERNFVPMDPVLNRGEFKSHEFHVREELRKPNTTHVEVKIKLFFEPGRKDPFKMFYDVFVFYSGITTPFNFGAIFYS